MFMVCSPGSRTLNWSSAVWVHDGGVKLLLSASGIYTLFGTRSQLTGSSQNIVSNYSSDGDLWTYN